MDDTKNRYAIILAAGKGTRFRSDLPKVLHNLCGVPMITVLLDKLSQLPIRETYVVVGYGADQVEKALDGYPVHFVLQEEQKGTAHAVQCALSAMAGKTGDVLILYGDTVMMSPETLKGLIEAHGKSAADLTLSTLDMEDPAGYGRIIRDSRGRLKKVVEERDASRRERLLREVNPGLYCFDLEKLVPALGKIDPGNRQGEYYLTDCVETLLVEGAKVETYRMSHSGVLGINTRAELIQAQRRLFRRIAHGWLERGVEVLDPDSVFLDATVQIGEDTVIYPGAIIEGRSRIGAGCRIRAYTHLRDVMIGDGTLIDHGCVVRDSRIGQGAQIGPYAHLRGGCVVGDNTRIGNFVEVKQSTIGDGSKAVHLTYLGNAELGREVNIGAGTITCNYDGLNKNETIIEDDVFIGSNTQLIAPVRIGKGAYVAAGSTVTEDVPPGSLAIARSRQVTKKDWRPPHKDK